MSSLGETEQAACKGLVRGRRLFSEVLAALTAEQGTDWSEPW